MKDDKHYVCPILSVTRQDGDLNYCEEDNCAWWIEHMECCAISGIIRRLT